ncbi:MAG: extracellular solute-binding protein [Candidatus Zixiibacteriota bacterium]
MNDASAPYKWARRSTWVLGWVVCVSAAVMVTGSVMTLTSDLQRLVDVGASAIIGVVTILLVTNWKATGWRVRTGLLFLVLGLAIPTGLLAYDRFTVRVVRVVGNSHGGLRHDLDRFNNTFSNERLHVDLVVDWQDMNTNDRFEIAKRVLSGDIEADVIELDGIWLSTFVDDGTPKLRPLDDLYHEEFARRSLFEAPVRLARGQADNVTYAIPLYVDVGLWFYRRDILGNLASPIQLNALIELARGKASKVTSLEALIYQSAQYEGLNCFFYEMVALEDGAIGAFDSPGAVRALRRLHDWLYAAKSRTVPSSVLVFQEEESRRLFTMGFAVLLRNWPYVLQSWPENNAVPFDDVGVAQVEGARPVLGGWYLGIPRVVGTRQVEEAAKRVVAFLTSHEQMASRARYEVVNHRRIPPDRAVFAELKSEYPFMDAVESALNRAITRPRSADYLKLSSLLSEGLYSVLANPRATEAEMKNVLSEVQATRRSSAH